MARRRAGHPESSTPSGAGARGGPAAARSPGEPATAASPETPAPRGRAILTWPREGIPDGQGYLVAPAHPGLGTPEVRIAVPDDADADGEAVALAEAPNDPEIAAAVRGDPDAPPIPAERLYAGLGYTPPSKRFSGNLRVRLPTSLHRTLAAQAERQGVSLNTLIVAYLARQAGRVEAA